MNLRPRDLTAAAALLLAAGCASGGSSSRAATTLPQTRASAPSFAAETGVLTVWLKVPGSAARPKAGRRAPRYISPSTRSLTVGVDGASAAPAASNCTNGACTLTLRLSLGAHTLAFRLWDAANGAGDELASNTAASCPVTSGAVNTCSAVLYGTAASLQMTTVSANASGSQAVGFTYVNDPSTPFTIDALDADGNEILGLGAVAAAVSTTGSGITIAAPAPSASPLYDITDTNAAAQTLSISATPAPNSDGAALSTTVTIRGTPLSCAQNALTGQGVPLGSDAAFAVLGASTVTNAGPTIVTGDLGLSPGTAVTGFGPGTVAGGAIHAGDAAAAQAQLDLATAYENAAGRSNAVALPAEIGGLVLTPGVYMAPVTLAIAGTVTLDGQNNPDSVFIFQMATTLTTSADSSVVLINQADACNVFWQVGSSATIAASSIFNGTILAQASVSLGSGATVHGRVLVESGAVTLLSNTVSKPRP